MQRLSVEQVLDASRFEQLVRLDTREILAFVQEYYYRRFSPVLASHYVFSALTLAAWAASCWLAGLDFDGWMASFGFGLVGFLLLLPLHEWIHGLVYQFFGARDVRYGFSPKQFVAYAVAHHFVSDRREFTWVALMPFLVISVLLGGLALVLPQFQQVILAALMVHTAGTSGDFAMLNYLYIHRERELYTYDDADAQLTFFHAAIEQGE